MASSLFFSLGVFCRVQLGVQYLLCDYSDQIGTKGHDEQFRDDILGQRVAKVFHKLYRGTVAAVTRGPTIDKDLYTIIYDDSDREDIGLNELYGKSSGKVIIMRKQDESGELRLSTNPVQFHFFPQTNRPAYTL